MTNQKRKEKRLEKKKPKQIFKIQFTSSIWSVWCDDDFLTFLDDVGHDVADCVDGQPGVVALLLLLL